MTLLSQIKANMPALKVLLEQMSGHPYEDRMYRFYHGSFKVFQLQYYTTEAVELFRLIGKAAGSERLDEDFLEIVEDGIGKDFDLEMNRRWNHHTRPIVEAFLHTKYFVEMLVKYGEELDEEPNSLPSGWAAVLYLFKRRHVTPGT